MSNARGFGGCEMGMETQRLVPFREVSLTILDVFVLQLFDSGVYFQAVKWVSTTERVSTVSTISFCTLYADHLDLMMQMVLARLGRPHHLQVREHRA